MLVAKIKKAHDLTRPERAWLIKLVRARFGLKLKVDRDRLWLSRRFVKGVNKAKLQVSRDETVGASLYFAREIAKRYELGIFRKGK